MPRASTNNSTNNNAVDASNPRIAWTVAVAALAVLAGRELQRASTCALHPKDEARAAALVEAEVGRLWAESSRAADDADAQLKLLTKELIDVEKLASNLVGRAEDDAKAVGDEGEGEGEGGCEIESVGRAVTGDEAGEVGEFQVLERARRARGFGRGGVEEASDGERRGEFERIDETKERRYE